MIMELNSIFKKNKPIEKTTDKFKGSLNSLKKVYDFLKTHETVTPTQIHLKTKTAFKTTKESIKLLEYLGLINIISNKETSLVKLKERRKWEQVEI